MDRDRTLIAFLETKFEGIDSRFEELQGQMGSRFKGMQGQMDSRFEETQDQIRHTNVVVEGLRSDVKAVAEGHSLLSDKLDAISDDLKLERRLDRDEIKTAQRQQDRRTDELEARVERLEAAG